MDRLPVRIAAAMAAGSFLLGASTMPGAAQPAESFLARCGELREAIGKLERTDEEEMVTIAVSGRLSAVRSDGALVYLFMCAPPDPRIVCVTYETNGSKEGDEVILTGNYLARGPDHIQLDPCLHHRAK